RVELRQLQYFVVVAEELHFGRAAERLHIVPSAVSQQVRRLEHELGVALFDRTTRTVTLADGGRALLPRARRLLAEAAAIRVAARPVVDMAALRGLPLRLADRARNPPLHDLVLRSCRAAGFEPALGPAFTTDQDTLAAIGFGEPGWTVYYATQAGRLAPPQVV